MIIDNEPFKHAATMCEGGNLSREGNVIYSSIQERVLTRMGKIFKKKKKLDTEDKDHDGEINVSSPG